ncbi:GTP-binding protein Rit2 isoform X1 [Apis mellifera carnica]|uniref:small monomeric GTPase n=2 Tax=Apis TaxID=7459 RepID=A0A7M7LRZ2_APIME|nr:GTP-binding protein Rit2 isoform X1 [Apis mellifera]KAG9435194.1 GTP-binding protein Rit2 isoform X1 [Apis mellifera carnica]|eukprot:XP_006565909.1 GTP-binding protein Rit2 isoform X1 [Apis mellifera]
MYRICPDLIADTGVSIRVFQYVIKYVSQLVKDKSVALNGKNDVPVVSQPTTRCGVRVYKIVILGDGGVGKSEMIFSAVTLQFVSHSFLDYHDPTIEDSYQQQAVIDGEAALLDILDTAGQVEFTAMRDQYMRCGEGFMICYSVTDRHSFQEALEYRKLITRVRANEDIPLVLVGNKFDLQHQRKVTTEEGKALAEQLGCPFYETSAALRQFIDDAFYSLVRQIRAKERSRNSVRKHSRWWRLRSILAFIFRRKQRHVNNHYYSP